MVAFFISADFFVFRLLRPSQTICWNELKHDKSADIKNMNVKFVD